MASWNTLRSCIRTRWPWLKYVVAVGLVVLIGGGLGVALLGGGWCLGRERTVSSDLSHASFRVHLPLVRGGQRSTSSMQPLTFRSIATWVGLLLLCVSVLIPSSAYSSRLRLSIPRHWLRAEAGFLAHWHLNWPIVLGLMLVALRLGIALGYPEGIPGLWAFQDAKTKQILTVTSLWCLMFGFILRIAEQCEGLTQLCDSVLKCLEARSRRLLWLAAGLFVVAYGAFVIARHEMFNSEGYDLGVYAQAIWSTAHGRWFSQSIEVTNRLGDHFQPLLIVVAALYRLVPATATILIFQTLVLATGAFPVYSLATRQLGSRVFGLAFGLVYLLYPAIGFIERFDFHFEVIGVPLLLMAYDLEDRGRLRWASLCLALSLSAKEQFGLAAAALGLLSLLQRKRWRFGLAWAIIGVTWSLLVTLLVMPHFRGGILSDSFYRYCWLGTSPSDMVRNALSHPGLVLGKMLEGRKVFSLLQLTFPLAFLSLLDPAPLILSVPLFAMNLLSDSLPQFQIYHQYTAPVIPPLFIAGIRGGRKLLRFHGAGIADSALTVRRAWLSAAPVVMTLGAFLIDNPFTELNMLADPWYPLPNRRAVREALSYVSPSVSVLTTNSYVPHLYQREEVHFIPWPTASYGRRAEVLFLNLLDGRWQGRDIYREYVTRLAEEDYGIVFQREGVVVIQRGAGSREALVVLAEHWPMLIRVLDDTGILPLQEDRKEESPFLIEHRLSARLGDEIELVGYWLSADRVKPGESFDLILFWEAGDGIDVDYSVFSHLLDRDGAIHSQQDNYPLRGEHPTSHWSPGEIVADSYVLPVSRDAPVGPYQIEVGMYDWRTGQRLPALNRLGQRIS
jgi:uncharacterized membrane protein